MNSKICHQNPCPFLLRRLTVLVRISESFLPNERQCLDHADQSTLASVSIVTLAFGFAVCLAGLEADEETEGDEEDHAADGCERVGEEDRVRLHGGEGVGSEDWLEEEECVCGRHVDDGEVFTEMRVRSAYMRYAVLDGWTR